MEAGSSTKALDLTGGQERLSQNHQLISVASGMEAPLKTMGSPAWCLMLPRAAHWDPTDADSEGKSRDFPTLSLPFIQVPHQSWLLLDATTIISRALYPSLGLLSLCLRSSIPDITGKTLCLAETCQTVVLTLTDSQGSQSEVALQTLHSLRPHTSHIRLSCPCSCIMTDLCSSR